MVTIFLHLNDLYISQAESYSISFVFYCTGNYTIGEFSRDLVEYLLDTTINSNRITR